MVAVANHFTLNALRRALPDHSTLYTRNEVMKPAHIFSDQVNTVTQWFDGWNDIEQTIACYSLLKRLGPTQARFLSLVLEHLFKDTASDIYGLEQEANSKEFLMSLCKESKDVAVQQLLLHLPLLHPGNDDARREYLKVLPKILTHSIEYSIHEEECRQLLSLARVHPAFVQDERQSLNIWLQLLNDKGLENSGNANKIVPPGQQDRSRGPPPPGFPGSQQMFNNSLQHQPLTSTKSACELWRTNPRMHQPVTTAHSYGRNANHQNNNTGHHHHHHGPAAGMAGGHQLQQHQQLNHSMNGWRQQALHHTDSGIRIHGKDGGPGSKEHPSLSARPSRSLSFPVDPAHAHQAISPQSSLDSDEENMKRLNLGINEKGHPGMRDIPLWLKSLRLHKYSHIFYDLTYDEMLSLDDKYLETKQVTKGARNKILLSINKLKERKDTLKRLEKEVLQIGKLPQVLAEMKQILMTPIKPFVARDGATGEDADKPDGDQAEQPTLEQKLSNESAESVSSNTSSPDKTSSPAANSSASQEEKEPADGSVADQQKAAGTPGGGSPRGSNAAGSPQRSAEQLEEEGDELHTHITRVMGKACTQILVAQPDEECCLTYLGLLDRVMTHEGFSAADRRRLQSWKTQCQKLARTLATNRKLAGIEKGPRNWYDPLSYTATQTGAMTLAAQAGQAQNLQNRRRTAGRAVSLKVPSTGMQMRGGGAGGPLQQAQSMHKRLCPTNSYNPMNPAQPQQMLNLNRTKSAPINSSNQVQQMQDTEGINQSLETLCLSMTNHALDDDAKVDNSY